MKCDPAYFDIFGSLLEYVFHCHFTDGVDLQTKRNACFKIIQQNLPKIIENSMDRKCTNNNTFFSFNNTSYIMKKRNSQQGSYRNHTKITKFKNLRHPVNITPYEVLVISAFHSKNFVFRSYTENAIITPNGSTCVYCAGSRPSYSSLSPILCSKSSDCSICMLEIQETHITF